MQLEPLLRTTCLAFVLYGLTACGEIYTDVARDAYEKGDYVSAAKWFAKACEEKETESCRYLAEMYLRGQGIKQSIPQAAKFFRKACEGDDATSCAMLGVLYFTGKDIRKDHTMAKEYFGRACDLGDEDACDMYKNYNIARFALPILESLK